MNTENTIEDKTQRRRERGVSQRKFSLHCSAPFASLRYSVFSHDYISATFDQSIMDF